MTAAGRRLEIISILVVSGHTTSKEMAQGFGVTRRTILHDVSVLSYGYPAYTKPGEGGGIFIMDSYKPYNNILTPVEQERLKKCMMRQRGRIRKFSNVSCGNTVHINWNCS
jgi:predicted DNA-binding transcriptional regulator YafY